MTTDPGTLAMISALTVLLETNITFLVEGFVFGLIMSSIPFVIAAILAGFDYEVVSVFH